MQTIKHLSSLKMKITQLIYMFPYKHTYRLTWLWRIRPATFFIHLDPIKRGVFSNLKSILSRSCHWVSTHSSQFLTVPFTRIACGAKADFIMTALELSRQDEKCPVNQRKRTKFSMKTAAGIFSLYTNSLKMYPLCGNYENERMEFTLTLCLTR